MQVSYRCVLEQYTGEFIIQVSDKRVFVDMQSLESQVGFDLQVTGK